MLEARRRRSVDGEGRDAAASHLGCPLIHSSLTRTHRFQFNAPDFDYGVTVQILLKALTAAPYPDFSLCLALLGEAPVAVLPPVEEADAPSGDSANPTPADAVKAPSAHAGPSAGHLIDPLFVRLANLNSLLHSARFRAFWQTLASEEYEDVRNAAQAFNNFEDAVRGVVLGSVKGAFRAIGEERLGGYLNLKGE